MSLRIHFHQFTGSAEHPFACLCKSFKDRCSVDFNSVVLAVKYYSLFVCLLFIAPGYICPFYRIVIAYPVPVRFTHSFLDKQNESRERQCDVARLDCSQTDKDVIHRPRSARAGKNCVVGHQ